MSINEYIDKFIQNQGFIDQKVKILLAVSGGLDSMVMLHVMSSTDVEIGVATINYKLREHSDIESQMVVDYCSSQKLPLHLYECALDEQKSMISSNLQEKARNIRYEYFDHILKENGYTHLMTAHHRDDTIEGLFLSINRGSGLDGISVMKEVKGHLLRPLLNFSKSELLEYANLHEVSYEEDESNAGNQYDRNYIRNEIIPKIEMRFPFFRSSAHLSLSNLTNAASLLNHLVELSKDKYLEENEDGITIKCLDQIKDFPGARTYLFKLISQYGYNAVQSDEILESESTGALWKSASHVATKYHDKLIVKNICSSEFDDIVISHSGIFEMYNGHKLEISKQKKVLFEKSKSIEYIDGDLVQYPLTVRRWKHGDRMCPLGMKGNSKKIQDILTDEKINRLDKEKCLVLCSRDKIIWLMNIRLDNRFKVKKETTSFMKLQYKF
ncbi:MAG: tRNA lysidine(34) synthetase TilS [Saprospiraceae bacterium]|nr:tRNA lysidine(34) synthetase TilS [Saprospiraceae bacterium]